MSPECLKSFGLYFSYYDVVVLSKLFKWMRKSFRLPWILFFIFYGVFCGANLTVVYGMQKRNLQDKWGVYGRAKMVFIVLWKWCSSWRQYRGRSKYSVEVVSIRKTVKWTPHWCEPSKSLKNQILYLKNFIQKIKLQFPKCNFVSQEYSNPQG